jgi:hypothetical protein
MKTRLFEANKEDVKARTFSREELLMIHLSELPSTWDTWVPEQCTEQVATLDEIAKEVDYTLPYLECNDYTEDTQILYLKMIKDTMYTLFTKILERAEDMKEGVISNIEKFKTSTIAEASAISNKIRSIIMTD